MIKNRILLLIFILLPFLCIGCSDVKPEWLEMLSTNGVAVVFAMFCMFIVAPAVGIGIWRAGAWFANRAETLIQEHVQFTNSISRSYKAISECLVLLVEKVESLNANEPMWYRYNTEILKNIKSDIEQTHNKMSEIHNLIIKKRSNNG